MMNHHHKKIMEVRERNTRKIEREKGQNIHQCVRKRKTVPVRIETSPVRHNVETEEEENHYLEEEESDYDGFNTRASQTEGYESLEEGKDKNQEGKGEQNKHELDVEKLVSVSTEEERSSPIDEKLSELIKTNWDSKKPLENMKKIFKAYPCPENCIMDPPQVNTELWKLLNSTQRKADVKLVSVQKSLKKALNVNLKILDELKKNEVSMQSIAQKTVDMAAILGHASHEISVKRRVFIRGNINSQYKDLCSSTQPITSKLFGDDLPKLVKGLNLTNKIGSKYSKTYKKPYDRPQRGSYYIRKYDSFLGRGRGSLPYNRHSQHNQNRQKLLKKSHH